MDVATRVLTPWTAHGAGLPPFLPFPREFVAGEGNLDLTRGGQVLVREPATERTRQIARLLAQALVDQVEAPFFVEGDTGEAPGQDGESQILLYPQGQPRTDRSPVPEGGASLPAESSTEAYEVAIVPEHAVLRGASEAGLFWAAQTLLELLSQAPPPNGVPACTIADAPYKPIRGVHLYLPARDHIGFFKRFIAGAMARYKLNTLFLEVGAGMRLERHPEINFGWRKLTRAFPTPDASVRGPDGRAQDSVHRELAGGDILEKDEVGDLVRFCEQHGVEVIPEIQSLSHAYYLVTEHQEIAELPEAAWPDAYCPANEASYRLLFEVMDEYLEVIRPRRVHIGHDEWRAGGLCEKCRGGAAEWFTRDVLHIHAFLAERGIQTVMWSDHFTRAHHGLGLDNRSKDGTWWHAPPTADAQQAIAEKAPDILMVNWSWGTRFDKPELPMPEDELRDLGFRQIFGNFDAESFPNWSDRSAPDDVLGGEVSCWVSTEEAWFRHDILETLVWSANALWSKTWPSAPHMRAAVAEVMPALRGRLSGRPSTAPGKPLGRCVPLTLPSRSPAIGQEVARLVEAVQGEVTFSGIPFSIRQTDLITIASNHRVDLPVEGTADSLVLLLTMTPGDVAQSRWAADGRYWRPTDLTDGRVLAELRVSYEDGLSTRDTLRYGDHVAGHANGGARATYGARALPMRQDGNPEPRLWLYAWEWTNPRPDHPIVTATIVPAGHIPRNPESAPRLLVLAATAVHRSVGKTP